MFWKQVLEQAGMDCQVRNEYLSGAAGELPPQECWPELWLVHDHQKKRAEVVMQETNAASEKSGPWRCPNCQAEGEPAFFVCWNCGARRPHDGTDD